MALTGRLDDIAPAWFTAVGTALAYGVLLVLMFVVFFVVPYLLFVLF